MVLYLGLSKRPVRFSKIMDNVNLKFYLIFLESKTFCEIKKIVSKFSNVIFKKLQFVLTERNNFAI